MKTILLSLRLHFLLFFLFFFKFDLQRHFFFSHLNFPSKLTHPLLLQSTGIEHVSTELSGSSNGRNDNVCAHIGVSSMAGTEGWTMDPPAAREYAVDPVIK